MGILFMARWSALASLLVATPGVAENRWSLGASIGSADLGPFCTRVDAGTCGSETAVKFHAGHDVLRNVHLEISWLEMTRRSDFVDAASGGKSFEVDIDGPAISVLPVFDLNDSVRLYGRAGLFRWSLTGFSKSFDETIDEFVTTNELSSEGTDAFGGVGARYLFERSAIRLEWEQYRVDSTDIPILWAGYEYTF